VGGKAVRREFFMISDEYVKQLFRETWRIQSKHYDYKKPLYTQLFMGVNSLRWEGQHPCGCKRHLSAFSKYNIIPRYCFDCYKVLIEPRTVVELFKLMVVFEKLDLPGDNTRKCMVENREQVPGAYKGLIYCRSLEEAKEIVKTVNQAVSTEISENIPVSLKRGCSEYTSLYPNYAHISQDDTTTTMNYKDEWQEYENLTNQEWAVNTPPAVGHIHTPLTYTAEDAQAMLGWLKYAATIGDKSYLNICWSLQPFQNVTRPSSFHPVEDE